MHSCRNNRTLLFSERNWTVFAKKSSDRDLVGRQLQLLFCRGHSSYSSEICFILCLRALLAMLWIRNVLFRIQLRIRIQPILFKDIKHLKFNKNEESTLSVVEPHISNLLVQCTRVFCIH